jgi:flagellar biosynthesis protein FlhF
MKLKTIQAPTMADALAAVKRELGRDAIILHTRTLRRGGWFFGLPRRQVVEVTASDRTGLPADPAARRPTRDGRRRPPAREGADRRTGWGPGRADRLLRDVYGAGESAPSRGQVSGQVDPLRKEMAAIRDLVQSLVTESRRAHGPAGPGELAELYTMLLQNEVAESLAGDLVDQVRKSVRPEALTDPAAVRQHLAGLLESLIRVEGPIRPVRKRDRPYVVALIGPTGVGKTTTIAKLAASFKLRQHLKVGLITIDTYRIAAVDQLRTYAGILDVALKVVITPAELKRKLAELAHCDVVLIDTAGRSQHDTLRLNELKAFLAVAVPDETHLVLSCVGQPSCLVDVIQQFAALRFNRVILTKLDEAVHFGILLTVLAKAEHGLSYVTTGQDVPDDIEIGEPRRLAKMILGEDHDLL